MKTKHTINQDQKLEELNAKMLSANLINFRIEANRVAVQMMKRTLHTTTDTERRNHILSQINSLENELSGCKPIDVKAIEIEKIKLINNN